MREGTQIEEDHMRNRQMIVRWLMANTKAIEERTRDGKTYFVMVDPKAFRDGVGRLLAEVQRIKSEGDYAAAKAVRDLRRALRPEAARRGGGARRQLNLPSYTGFVMPKLPAAFSRLCVRPSIHEACVTLSHFCPTAANRLFDVDVEVSIVEDLPILTLGEELPRPSAREALPPAVLGLARTAAAAPAPCPHPARVRLLLHSPDAVSGWQLVARLGSDSVYPDAPERRRVRSRAGGGPPRLGLARSACRRRARLAFAGGSPVGELDAVIGRYLAAKLRLVTSP